MELKDLRDQLEIKDHVDILAQKVQLDQLDQKEKKEKKVKWDQQDQ